MNKAFEKIINELKQESIIVDDDAGHRAVEIIEQIAEEYKSTEHINCSTNSSTSGWIPCSERLPEEHDSVFARFKGTDKWNDFMFGKISDIVNVTVIDKIGNSITTYARTVDGMFKCDLLDINKTYRIIAWQPLPEPYKESK